MASDGVENALLMPSQLSDGLLHRCASSHFPPWSLVTMGIVVEEMGPVVKLLSLWLSCDVVSKILG